MQNLPSPILGNITALTITAPDLDQSLNYYKKLGFKELFRADFPFPWIQITDGVLLIMLRKDPKPYLALTYYVEDIESVVKMLDAKGIQFVSRPGKADMVKRYLFESPDGLNISLVSVVEGFSQPKGPGMLQMDQEDYFKPSKYVNKKCGMFGELAHPVTNLNVSLEFWRLLGFTAVSNFTAPYPWAIITDGLSVVGLHETTHFSFPAITFFAADMRDKISDLVKNGLTDFQEKGQGNIVLTTPEKQHIFLFSLGGGVQPANNDENAGTNIEIQLKPVAYVKNIRKMPTDDFWGNVISEITLAEGISVEAFDNIEDFSHLEILFYFDRVEDNAIVFSGRARGNPNYPRNGIFAQRKKDRPNKIGLSTVELLSHSGRTIIVRNLDAIDDTPILDIKPVFKEFQPSKEIKQPEWVTDMMQNYWKEES